jgi:hypothetical protein
LEVVGRCKIVRGVPAAYNDLELAYIARIAFYTPGEGPGVIGLPWLPFSHF